MPIRQRGSRRTSNVHSPKRCYEVPTRTPRALNDSLHPKFPARNSHSAVAVGDTVYVIAGDRGSAVREDVWTSGDKGAAWTQVPASAEFPARRNHASAAQGGALYVIGGSASSTRLFNDVWKSTDGGASWVNVHENP